MAENNPDSRWETRFEDAREIRLEDAAYREAAYVHIDGKKYLATEFPFEERYGDYSALEKTVRLNKSKDYPLALVAATVARIANTRMDETKNEGKAKMPHSPTYPIKDGDLVWFAYCELEGDGSEKWKECEKPFEVKIGGQGAFDTSVRAVPQGGYSEDYREMGQILNGHVGREVKVRIYRHADLSQEYLEKTIEPVVERTAGRSPAAKTDITSIFVDERENPIELDE